MRFKRTATVLERTVKYCPARRELRKLVLRGPLPSDGHNRLEYGKPIHRERH